jgi:glycosyltransferase involved in cell wall biosynthesis
MFSLVCPCLNEEGNIEELATRFISCAQQANIDVEIVFVDDGSSDGTWQKMLEVDEKYPGRIVLIQHSKNLGIPNAWKSGLDKANGSISGLIDSDLQNPPESAVELYKCLMGNSLDLVRGVRRPVFHTEFSRKLMSKMLNSILNLVFGMSSADNKSGFIVGKREIIERMVSHKNTYKHFQTFIGVATRSLEIRQIEIVTPFMRRSSGESFLNGKTLRTTLEVLLDIPTAAKEYGWRLKR